MPGCTWPCICTQEAPNPIEVLPHSTRPRDPASTGHANHNIERGELRPPLVIVPCPSSSRRQARVPQLHCSDSGRWGGFLAATNARGQGPVNVGSRFTQPAAPADDFPAPFDENIARCVRRDIFLVFTYLFALLHLVLSSNHPFWRLVCPLLLRQFCRRN